MAILAASAISASVTASNPRAAMSAASSFAGIAAAVWCDGIPVMQLIWLQHCAVGEAAQPHCSGRLHGWALRVEVPAPVVIRRLHHCFEVAGANGWVGVVVGVGKRHAATP
jgi:hypothetical protein